MAGGPARLSGLRGAPLFAAANVTGPALPILSIVEARRLALDAQLLGRQAGGEEEFDLERVIGMVQRLGYLQRDPLSVVAPSHRMVLWSRLGHDAGKEVDTALWQQRSLFEYWAHAAAIVPTSDFQLHRWRMQHYRRGSVPFDAANQGWLERNRSLRRAILRRLDREGPLPALAFAERSAAPSASGWGSWRDHQRMLEVLWFQGLVTVTGRDHRGRLWGLTESWLPETLAAPQIPKHKALLELSARSLSALGVATRRQVATHLMGGSPPTVMASIDRLCTMGLATEVAVHGASGAIPGRWIASIAALKSWEEGRLGDWSGRTTLLSPFDNLIIDRARTEAIFDFHYRMEIYVPRSRRRYGYYVLPILHQDKLVGRLDCQRDLGVGSLEVVSIHAEPAVPPASEIGESIRAALWSLAAAVGMEQVAVRDPAGVPPPWRSALSY